MKVLGLFFRVVIWLLLLSTGISLLVIGSWFHEPTRGLFVETMVQSVYNVLMSPSWFVRIWPGVAVTALAILAVLPAILTPVKRSVIAFSSPDGAVEISVEAVKSFVTRLCNSAAGVKEVREVQVSERQSGTDIRIRLTLGSGSQVPETTSRCRERVKQELKTILGIQKINRVVINVDGVEPSTLPGVLPESPRPPASPFSMSDDSEDSDDR